VNDDKKTNPTMPAFMSAEAVEAARPMFSPWYMCTCERIPHLSTCPRSKLPDEVLATLTAEPSLLQRVVAQVLALLPREYPGKTSEALFRARTGVELALADLGQGDTSGARVNAVSAMADLLAGTVVLTSTAVALPDEIPVDGLTPHPEVTLWGKATRQPDGTYQCFANVAGLLCRVEVKIGAADATKEQSR